MKIFSLLVGLVLLVLLGCSADQGLESLAPKSELAISKGLFNQLQSRDFNTLVNEIDQTADHQI